MQSFVAKHGIPVLRQAPYSPDMAPCDFWFPKLKRPLKGYCFDSCEDIMQNVTKKLSRNASSCGRNIGLSLWSHKGPTLKGIRN
jgi:transposase